ncbi:MAG: PIG-L deacetylase family protein [Acidobacteriota bacterium]
MPAVPRRTGAVLRMLVGLAWLAASGQTAAECVPDSTHACLSNGRYRAEVVWREPRFAPDGASGYVFPLTNESAAFWFFAPGNLEVVCKVLDGRALNGRFWLFTAALTSVEFDLRVTDSVAGWRKSWFHSASAPSSQADVGAFSEDPLPGSVMFLGAHPDDETTAAPLLGRFCVELGQRCSLLVATRGESGQCRLPGGCLPDLASVRTREMQAAAALFGAALTQWDLPDLPGPDPEAVRAAWAARSGGDEALVMRIAGAIAASAPQTVVTYDPQHGSTCHPAHRALGSLVLDALARLGGSAPATFLLETRVERPENGEAVHFSPFVPEDSRAFAFDATLARGGPARGTAWDFLIEDARAHPSQFTTSFLRSLSSVPDSDREVRLLPRPDFGEDPRYAGLCAGDRPGAAGEEAPDEADQVNP